ncbi:unnamed protein product [Brassica oleracea var. botrytis]
MDETRRSRQNQKGRRETRRFDATFKGSDQPTPLIEPPPSKSTASGAGIGGVTAWAPSTFIVTTEDLLDQ